MNFDPDINENDILNLDTEVLSKLLIDHTTKQNILWASNDYVNLGDGYGFHDHILPELITGDKAYVIRPRVLKEKELQTARSKDKAEVFTPSWVCNTQNNLIDEAWFGRKDVFNTEVVNEDGSRDWIPTKGKIVFEDEDSPRSWKKYVRDTRLEITCGEAPYLVSRYDTTTGQPIPLEKRIGLIDRKLRVVSENTTTSKDWLTYAQAAYENTYGYEWQGDSLLIAREAMLVSFIEYYRAKFGKNPNLRSVRYIAYVVSWNLWQMDGLKYVIPDSCHDDVFTNILGEETRTPCKGCKDGTATNHNGLHCLVRDWRMFHSKKAGDDKSRYDIPFITLITRNSSIK